MVNIAGHYDETAEPSSGDFDPIPAGEYLAVIEQANVEDISSRDDKGRCLVLTWKVQGSANDGRLLWQRLNLWAENFAAGIDKKTGQHMSSEEKTAQSINIANSQFATVRSALGFRTPDNPNGRPFGDNTDELLQIPCLIKVKVVPATDQYPAKNEVTNVKPANTGPATRSAPPASRGPAQQSRGPAPAGKAPAATGGKANPFGHLKSGGQTRELVDDEIPF